MSTPITFGVYGLGRIGVQHCQHFSAQTDRYQPVGFCDLDAGRAEQAAKAYGGTAYTDSVSFLANEAMQLVIIATRSLDHTRHATEALAAGKIVLLEKPIGVTAADYRILQQLDRDYPGKLFFCHNHRFEPAFANARAIIAEGCLGNVNVIKLSKHHGFIRRNDWQMRLDCGGGQLSVWAPHMIDQAMQLIGAPIRTVTSHLRRVLTAGDADDYVRIFLTGENDIVAEIEISNSVVLPAPYCTISGDRGELQYAQDQKAIRVKYLAPGFSWSAENASDDTPEINQASYGFRDLPWVDEMRTVEPDVNMWEYVEDEIARHLYNAIANGIPFPVKNSDALEVVRITEVVKAQNPQFNWIG